ncbi:MAG: helix-turn-helix domain-containing protein [Bacteroidota bacterium]
MPFNLFDIIILVSLTQGLLLGAVLLFGRFFKGNHNQYLALSIIMIAFIGLEEWLGAWNLDDVYYIVDLGDDIPWILLFYVPLFYYFLQKLEHPRRNKPYWWLLCLPFGLFFCLNLYINLAVDFGLYQIPNEEAFMISVYDAEIICAAIYNLILCGYSYWLISRYQVQSEIQRWLYRIWLFTLLLIASWICILLIEGMDASDFVDSGSGYIIWGGVSVFIYWLIYKGIYRFQLVQDQQMVDSLLRQQVSKGKESSVPRVAVNPQKEKPINQSLEKNISLGENPYYQQLLQLMQQEHMYREQDLSRDRVAERLGISPGYLSEVLRKQGDQNFSTFVNSFRVEAVKEMLGQSEFDKYSLLAIGMEAGFKSKTAFYTTFKKATGQTPKAFQQQIR